MRIFTKNTLRRQVETLTDGKVTVLYDSSGYPSYMRMIPRMRIRDVLNIPDTNNSTNDYNYLYQNVFFKAALSDLDSTDYGKVTTFLNNYHPAFWVYEQNGDSSTYFKGYADRIFIGQFIQQDNTFTTSMPEIRCDLLKTRSVQNFYESLAEKNGDNTNNRWRSLSIWDIALLKMYGYTHDLPWCGIDVNTFSYTIRTPELDSNNIPTGKLTLKTIDLTSDEWRSPVGYPCDIRFAIDTTSWDHTSVKNCVLVNESIPGSEGIIIDSSSGDSTTVWLTVRLTHGKFHSDNTVKVIVNTNIQYRGNITSETTLCNYKTGYNTYSSFDLENNPLTGIEDIIFPHTFCDGLVFSKVEYAGAPGHYCYVPFFYKGNVLRSDTSNLNDLFGDVSTILNNTAIYNTNCKLVYNKDDSRFYLMGQSVSPSGAYDGPDATYLDITSYSSFYLSQFGGYANNVDLKTKLYLSLMCLGLGIRDYTSTIKTNFECGIQEKRVSGSEVSFACDTTSAFYTVFMNPYSGIYNRPGYKLFNLYIHKPNFNIALPPAIFRVAYTGQVIEDTESPDPPIC